MIKCIVCDLDGTLIRYDDTIEEKTLQLLRQCIEQGIEFIIATGRDINMVKDIIEKYHFHCDLILNNGTQYINKERTMNEIYPMNNQAFIDIATILHQYRYLLAIHTDHGKYSLVDQETFWDYHMKLLLQSSQFPTEKELPRKTFTTREGYLRDFHYAPTPQDIINQGVKVLKIDARHLDVKSIEGVKDRLNIEHLLYSSSFEDNIEITSDVIDKGRMLKKVLSQKGYHMDEVATFGDGINDVGLLDVLYSFVPANACHQVQKKAHHILTLTNEEGAVGEGIQWLKDKNLI